MVKLLFFVAIATNVVLMVSTGTASDQGKTLSSSSSAASSSASSSSSTTNSGGSSESHSSAHASASAASSTTNSDDSDDEGCSTDDDHHCRANEEYSKCPDAVCEPKTCDQLGFPISCPAQAADGSCPGKPGCICKNGYVRDCNGKCIPSSECPSCGGDENAVAGCGVNCYRHCSDIGKEPGGCAAVCYLNACDCRKGYYLDDNTGKCVLPDQCRVCPTNEIFDKCSYEGQCSPGTCDSIGKSYSCPAQLHCKAQCRCKDGYYRNELGQCVSEDECSKCKNTNEVYDLCPPICPPQTCESIGQSYSCPAIIPDYCNPAACRCIPGYLRNKIGQCISEEDCLKCTGPHEYFSCGGACDNVCSTLREQNQTHCPIINIKCNEKCYCEKDYARDSNGICIHIKDCPDSCGCGGDPNAEPGCGTNCGKHCYDYNPKPAACPHSCVVNGCDCKDGYVFDENIKKCVLPCDCSPVTTTTTTTTAAPGGDCNQETAVDRFSEGNTDFTLNFLYQMITNNPLVSVVMSPFICLVPLAELALYTEPGESYDQLMNALNLNTKDEIRSVFPVILNSLTAQQNVTLDLGAKIYVNKDFQLTDNFEKDTKNIFDAEAENINFGDPDNAADIINAWVEDITRGLIKTLVAPNMFDSGTRMVLTNAIYFLGNWVDQFNPNSTQVEDFHVSNDKTVQVSMMFRKGSYKYTESSDLDCKIAEIPYKGGNFSYVILVPNQIEGYSTVAEKIRDPQVLNDALDALQSETCYLYLPRHEITTSIDLTKILNLLNITDLFDEKKSNLSGILTNSEKLFVTDAIQKANIKVDETGTEAAAVTGIISGVTSSQPDTTKEIKADRPFLYILYQDRQPLFCGAYAADD